ncbi:MULTISPECIES: amidohydrolase [unclassified Leucobacter]|uniref:amidohydrolase n=1 Tax=unclassified Leucobacter TaxID=2621730 RepID=UPI00165EAE3A|nr:MULTISPECIES: amidohydrolase [unclassified Leucobacter]MBC9937025.1 amidohydrolase [Leucobacter sp. cx-87]
MRSVLYVHPNIRSLDASESVHGAMLVTDGRIAALGTPVDLAARATPGTETIELPGEVVLPGFHDAHIHTGNLAREIGAPDLRGLASLDDALGVLRDYATANPGDTWVLGGRWDRNAWQGRPEPTRHHLDQIFGARPVALPSVDGHSVWANTAGLRAAGITAGSGDPVGGRIAREAGGTEPSGLLFESAMDEIRELSEAAIAADLHLYLREAHRRLLATGITHVTNFEGEDVRAAYTRLRQDGELGLRAHLGLSMDALDLAIGEGRRTGDGDEWITTGPVKLFSDGALGSHTAHLHHAFEGDPGNQGIEVIPFAQLCELVDRAVTHGIAVATHAIGDRANTLVLDAYERAHAQTRAAGLTNRIEHAQHLHWADVPRFTELGVVASMQPIHCTSDFPLSVELLGDRDIAHYPWRSLIDAGALVAFGSDAPVEPENPLFGVHAAVTRMRRDGVPPGGREPEQRVSLTEALRGFTSAPARAAGLGPEFGRLAVGAHADFVALSQDPYAVDPSEIAGLSVALTAVAGDVVHTA